MRHRIGKMSLEEVVFISGTSTNGQPKLQLFQDKLESQMHKHGFNTFNYD